METILTFELTMVDGTKETQQIGVPPDRIEPAILAMFQQFGSVGIVRKNETEGKFLLTPSSQIARVEVDIPKVSIANSLDVNAMRQAADNLKKILPG
jgi:hypothetical protein